MTLNLSAECSVCGCTGLHACIGYKPKPLTPEEERRINEKLEELFSRVVDEEAAFVSEQMSRAFYRENPRPAEELLEESKARRIKLMRQLRFSSSI